MAVQVSRILHAGYVFKCAGVQIAFDPIFENPFSRNCYAFPEVEFQKDLIKTQHFDAVFISHYHDDHCSFESLNLLDRKTPIYIYCVYEELLDWIRELGFSNVIPLEIGFPVQVGPFQITTRLALDADVDSLFHIQAEGLNILNVVDSWIGPSTLKQLERTHVWDLILWPFQTMREMEVLSPRRVKNVPPALPTEWTEQLKILKPKYLVPSSCQFQFESWSWYNLAFFPISYVSFEKVMNLEIPDTQIVRLDPGKSILLSSERFIPTEPLSWVKTIGEQKPDYKFDPDFVPQTTSEIAKLLPNLLTDEAEIVQTYCKSYLPEKLKEIHESSDPYFDTNRIWQLSVFSNDGTSTNYFYSIRSNQISLLQDQKGPAEIGWRTEVPEFTLYGALVRGESLTSMYIRVNDLKLNSQIEAQLETVEPLEDPLIRALYQGAFGSYQLAQLKKLKAQTNS